MGRAAQGVRILNIERPDTLIGIDTVAQEDDEAKRLEEMENKVISIAGELDIDGSDEVIETGLVDEDDDTNGEEPKPDLTDE